MTKTKQWKWTLVALCAVLVLSLGAIGFSAIMQRADADQLVLDGNSAEYTIANDAKNSWLWDKATNTWETPLKYSYTSATLTLDVTKAGNISFEYIAVGTVNVNNNPENYLTISKNDEPLVNQKYDMGEYESLSITVEPSDKITFSYKRQTEGRQDCYALIKGLRHEWQDGIQNQVSLSVEGSGTVAIGDSDSYSDSATQQVTFGDSVTIKAKAAEGNIFYGWYDQTDVLVSLDAEYVVNNVINEAQLTAKFVPAEHETETIGQGWIKEESGYKTSGIQKSTSYVVTKEVTGSGYLCINYSYFKNTGLGDFGIIVDGKTILSRSDKQAVAVEADISCKLETSGIHIVSFILNSGASGSDTFVKISIKTVEIKSEQDMNLQTVNVNWNERFGDVYYLTDSQITTATSTDVVVKGKKLTEKEIKLPKGTKITLWAVPRKGVVSQVVQGKRFDAAFLGYFVDSAGESTSTAIMLTGTMGEDNFATGKSIEVRFKESIPAPKIELTKTIEKDENKTIINNGDTIDVLLGSENKLVFYIYKYKTIEVEKLTVTYNGKNQTVSDEYVDYFGVVLSNVTDRAKIEFIFDFGEYFAEKVVIQVNITRPNGVQDVVFEGASVTAVNDETYPWFFDTGISSKQEVVYTSGISYGECFASYKYSALKFTVQGQGSFSFEFYLDGYNNNSWAGFSFEQPVTPKDNTDPTKVGASASQGLQALSDSSTFEISNGFNLAKSTSSDGINPSKATIWDQPHRDGATYSVSELEDGWFKADITISSDGETTVYVIHAFNNSSRTKSYPVTQMSVRNVKFFTGSKKLSWEVQNGAETVSAENGTITATVDGQSKTSGDEILAGTRVHFAVNVLNDNQFYFWKDGNGKILSYDTEFDFPLADKDSQVIAVIDEPNKFEARVGGKLFEMVEGALNYANDGDSVVLLKSAEIEESVTVKKSVSLILPINSDGDYYELGNDGNADKVISWTQGGTYETPVIILTVAKDAIITLNGNLYVGGVLHYPDQSAQGHTSGAYAQLVLNGTINVEEGGVLDVYGRVTGDGSIVVNSGGVLYQPFLILDFAGGQNTQDLFNNHQTPFKRYAMINIQCKGGYTINYGGELWGHASLYFLSSVTTLDTQFISYQGTVKVNGVDKNGTTTLINLKAGVNASVHGVYKEEKILDCPSNNTELIGHTELTITGGAAAGYMDFLGLVQTDVVAFSIPYNYSIVLQNGEFDMAYDYKLMPGASFTVEDDATLNLNAKFYVYDGLLQSKMSGKYYPTAEQLTKNSYYTTNANFFVNGKFNINSGATFLGVIQSTKANATVKTAADAVLSGTIKDGDTTKYDCNYSEYESSARIFDAAHGEHGTLVTMQNDCTYNSRTTVEGWTLNGVATKYDKDDFGNADKMKEHHHTMTEATLESVTGLLGSWVLKHSSHVFDWTLTAEEYGDLKDGNNHKELTRQCTQVGCTEKEHKQLLWVPESIGNLTYDGEDVTEADINGLLNSLYGDLSLETSFEGLNARNAKDGYTVTVTLSNGLWLVENAGVKRVQLSFNVKQKEITVTPTDQTFEYGQEVRLSPTAYRADTCGDDVLDLSLKIQGDVVPHDAGNYTIEVVLGSNPNYSITPATGTCKVTKLSITVTMPSKTRDYDGKVPAVEDLTKPTADKALGYQDKIEDLVTMTIQNAAKDAATYVVHGTATEQSKTNYEITVTDGSYTVTPKKVTVKADPKTSVYGKDIEQLTYQIPDLVAGDSLDEYISITTNATNASPVGSSYVITVTWKDENKPQNYEVQFENATYTITEAAFEGISFGNGNFTYDGTVHNITVTGAPDGAKVEYKCKEQKFDGAKDVGTYEITATVSLANYNNQDYHATLTISARKLTVNLPEYSREYNGKVPQISDIEALLSIADTSENSTLGEGDNLSEIVTLTIVGAAKDVKDYTVTGKCNNDNYTIDFVKDGVYKVVPAEITVKVLPQSKTYDGNEAEAKSDSEYWQITAGAEKVVSDDDKPFGVTLTLDGKSSYKNVGFYNIKGECTNDNYRVTFTDEANAYEIKARTLTVTARSQQSVYGEQVVTKLDYDIDGKIDDGTTVDVSVTCAVEAGSHYRQEGYEITVTVTNKESLTNYNVVEVNGLYTVTKRPVKVTILPQTDVYGFGKTTYAWNDDLWTAEENSPASGLASGESKEVLGVTLTQPHITGAGSYPIVATASNNDYQVTFEGEWHSDDANNGKAGVYTVSKLTLTDGEEETVFNLYVDGKPFNTQMPQRYPYVNKALTLTADVSVWEGDNYREQPLAATVSPSTLEALGVHVVTVTIDDDNYCGTCTFNVEVVRADGYSQTLLEVLSNLEELAGNLSADTITATQENYATVKGIVTELNKLSDEDKRVGEEELAPYIEIVEAWDSAADIDDGVIETAQAIADAPLKGLFAIVALNALVAAAYVIAKGGIL